MTALERVAALRARVTARSFDTAFTEPRRIGRLTRIVGLTMEASGCALTVGARCEVQSSHCSLEAEVVGFHGERTLLMPFGDITGLDQAGALEIARRRVPNATFLERVHRLDTCEEMYDDP